MSIAASIIVTTYNRPERLKALCESLLQQDYPLENLELVIVDDGSVVPVAPLVEAYRARMQTTIHRQVNSGPAVGRNVAVDLARGKFVLMIDDDCRPDPRWASRLLAVLERHPRAMVGGFTINALPGNIFSAVSQMVVDRVYEVHNRNPSDAGFFTSSNAGLARAEFRSIGGFDPRYRFAGGEDRGFSDRWRNSGRPMIFEPEAIIFHYHELNLGQFLRQHFRYGRGALHYHLTRDTRHHEEALTARRIVFDLSAWRRKIREQRGKHSVAELAILLVAWQAANAAGYFWEALVRRTRFASTAGT